MSQWSSVTILTFVKIPKAKCQNFLVSGWIVASITVVLLGIWSTDYTPKLWLVLKTTVQKMKAIFFLGGGVKKELTGTLFHKGEQYTHNFTYS